MRPAPSARPRATRVGWVRRTAVPVACRNGASGGDHPGRGGSVPTERADLRVRGLQALAKVLHRLFLLSHAVRQAHDYFHAGEVDAQILDEALDLARS